MAGDSRLPFCTEPPICCPKGGRRGCLTTKRFTMVPPFDREQTVYTYYGLKPALEWFEQQDVMAGGLGRLKERALSAVGKAKDVLEQDRNGGRVLCSECCCPVEAVVERGGDGVGAFGRRCGR